MLKKGARPKITAPGVSHQLQMTTAAEAEGTDGHLPHARPGLSALWIHALNPSSHTGQANRITIPILHLRKSRALSHLLRVAKLEAAEPQSFLCFEKAGNQKTAPMLYPGEEAGELVSREGGEPGPKPAGVLRDRPLPV